MAQLPTAEETARTILDIFVSHFNNRAGDVLGFGNFNAIWHQRGLRTADFKPGMEYAVKQGWVDVVPADPGGESFRLTDAGFAEA
jgi:hypothetical protein